MHAAWERYVEERLIVALNHDPKYFLKENGISGIVRVRRGLALYFVRGGKDYFDFRNMEELHRRAKAIVGKSRDPFRAITPDDQKELDAMAVIRNRLVHNSDFAHRKYRSKVAKSHGLKRPPLFAVDFLMARDRRNGKPSRLHSIADAMRRAIDCS